MGSRLVLGGQFQFVAGYRRDGMAVVHPRGNLSVDTNFWPVPGIGTVGFIRALAASSSGGWYAGHGRVFKFRSDGAFADDWTATPELDDGNPAVFGFPVSSIVELASTVLVGYRQGVGGTGPLTEADSLKRYSLDGQPDASYVPPSGITGSIPVKKIVQAPDGKLYVLRQYVSRLNADGTDDATFTPFTVAAGINDLLMQPDGKLVLATDSGLERRNPDGTTDGSFTTVASDAPVQCLGQLLNGHILASGAFTTIGGVAKSYLAAVSLAGVVDTGFTAPPEVIEGAKNCIVLQDGSMLLMATFNYPIRLEADGTYLGRYVCTNAADNLEPVLVALEVDAYLPPVADTVETSPGQKVLVAGGFEVTALEPSGMLFQVNSDGTLDVATWPAMAQTGASSRMNGILELSTGKVVVYGRDIYVVSEGAAQDGWVLNANKTVDTGFAYPGTGLSCETALELPNGQLLFGSTGNFGGSASILRTSAAGVVDGTFPDLDVPAPTPPGTGPPYIKLGLALDSAGDVWVWPGLNVGTNCVTKITDDGVELFSITGGPIRCFHEAASGKALLGGFGDLALSASFAAVELDAAGALRYAVSPFFRSLNDHRFLCVRANGDRLYEGLIDAPPYDEGLKTVSATGSVSALLFTEDTVAINGAAVELENGQLLAVVLQADGGLTRFAANYTVDGTYTTTLTWQFGSGSGVFAIGPDGKRYLSIDGQTFQVDGGASQTGTIRLNADGSHDTTWSPAIQSEATRIWGFHATGEVEWFGNSLDQLKRAETNGTIDTAFVTVSNCNAASSAAAPADAGRVWALDTSTETLHLRDSVGASVLSLADVEAVCAGAIGGACYAQRGSTNNYEVVLVQTDGTYAGVGFNDNRTISPAPAGGVIMWGDGDDVAISLATTGALAEVDVASGAPTTIPLDFVHYDEASAAALDEIPPIVMDIVDRTGGGFYILGEFDVVAGHATKNVAALLSDYTVDTSFAVSQSVNFRFDVDRVEVGVDFWWEGRIAERTGGGVAVTSGAGALFLSATGAVDDVVLAYTAPPPFNAPSPLLALSSGDFVVGGSWRYAQYGRQANLARLDAADWSLDTAFDPLVNGKVLALARQADGKILIGGEFTEVAGVRRIGMARLHPNGALDTTFPSIDPSSQPLDSPSGTPVAISAILPQSDGSIIIAGNFQAGLDYGGIGGTDTSLICKIDQDGVVDTAWSSTDLAFTGSPNTWQNGFLEYEPHTSAAMTGSGQIMVAGDITYTTTSGTRYAIARINNDGTLDETFPGSVSAGSFANLHLASDGRVVARTLASGSTYTECFPDMPIRSRTIRGYDEGGLYHVSAAGVAQPAPSGGDVKYVTNINAATVLSSGDILTAARSDIVVDCLSSTPCTAECYLARINPDGTVDTNFAVTLFDAEYPDFTGPSFYRSGPAQRIHEIDSSHVLVCGPRLGINGPDAVAAYKWNTYPVPMFSVFLDPATGALDTTRTKQYPDVRAVLPYTAVTLVVESFAEAVTFSDSMTVTHETGPAPFSLNSGVGLADTLSVDFMAALFPNLAESLGFADSMSVKPDIFIFSFPNDAFTLSDSLSVLDVRRYLETIGFADSTSNLIDAMEAITEKMQFRDVVHYVWKFLFEDGFALSDDLATARQYMVDVADALALHGGGASQYMAQVVVAEALALAALHGFTLPVAISEALGLGDSHSTRLAATIEALDAIQLADTSTLALGMSFLVDENLVLDDATSLTAALHFAYEEGIGVLARLRLDDGLYLAWVFHAESRAYTEYRNFAFNSFCTMPDGRVFGAMADGIYELAGDDDAGTAIDAHIRGGLEQFGTARAKRLPEMFIGYRTDGNMVLKVIVTSAAGDKEEHWYRVIERTANAARESRVKIGRGLKSVYFGFELANVDGADFDLDEIAFHPMILERRIT